MFENFQCTDNGRSTAGRHCQSFNSTHTNCRSTQTQPLDNVRSAHESAVYHDRHPASDCSHHFGQRIDTSTCVIELSAAVIGDIDDVDSHLDTARGILGDINPFDEQRDVEVVFDVRDGLPGHSRLVVEIQRVRTRSGSRHMALEDVPFASGIGLRVGGETETRVTGIDRPPNEVVHPCLVAHEVELIDARARHELCNLFEIRRAHRTENLLHAKIRCRPRNRFGATSFEYLHRTDWGQKYRDSQWATQKLCVRLDLTDVIENSRPENPGVESRSVAPHR